MALLTDDTGEANACDGESTRSKVTRVVTALISESGLMARIVVIRKMMGCSRFEKGGELEGCKRLGCWISACTGKDLE